MIQERQAVQQALVMLPAIATAQAVATLEREIAKTTTDTALRTLDTGALMRAYYVRQYMEIFPFLPTEQVMRNVPLMQQLTEEEERYIRRSPLRVEVAQIERFKRFIETEPERKIAELERLRIDYPAVLSIEQIVLSLMEKLLWTTRQKDVIQVMQELMDMVESKRRYATRILGLEALTKQLLQLYVPYFMQPPLEHNMLGLRLSLLTLSLLKGKTAQIYISMAGLGLQLKQKAELISCQLRRLETKALALLKPLQKWWNTVHGLTQTDNLQKETEVPMMKDLKGKQTPTYIVLQVLSFKYLISRWFAHHVGEPENKWYYVYPRVEVIITRHGVKLRKYMRNPEWQIITFNRDLYMRNMRDWNKWH